MIEHLQCYEVPGDILHKQCGHHPQYNWKQNLKYLN
jgi:hypothetical protein